MSMSSCIVLRGYMDEHLHPCTASDLIGAFVN